MSISTIRCAALRRMRDRDQAGFEVEERESALKHNSQVVERKVTLPVRWIKGFCEVQAYQPRMIPQITMNKLEAREFFGPSPQQPRTDGLL
ncbi:MAG: hypothetical protein R3C11_17090 [Planctomycetaceae bacterium]